MFPLVRSSSPPKHIRGWDQSHSLFCFLFSSRLPIWLQHTSCTWSKSCLPVVLGRMANSNSASIVVTRTLICQRKQRKSSQMFISVSHWEKCWIAWKCTTGSTGSTNSGRKWLCSMQQSYKSWLVYRKISKKRVPLTFLCSVRSIQSQKVGGDYNQKRLSQ